MKFKTIPTKRLPVPQGIIRRLRAIIRNRKQRVAASSPAVAEEPDDDHSKIAQVLIGLFLVHIVAIGLIFFHQRFLSGHAPTSSARAKTGTAEVVPSSSAAPQSKDLPRMASGDKPYIVRAGDNYSRIATAEGVEEGSLRQLNKDVAIGPGLILKIPQKSIVAADTPEVTAPLEQKPSSHARGFQPVEAMSVNVKAAPKAHPVRFSGTRETPPSPPATQQKAISGKSYVVQPGDSIWRIANRCKVSQDSLMRANGISDPRKMKTGMKLAIPKS